MSDSLFGDDQTPPNDDTDFFEQLVGDGKKYKTPQLLAKSAVDKDKFIEQLKTEMSELRGELKTRLTLEELADQALSRRKDDETPPTPRQDVAPENRDTPVDLQKEVLRLLQEERSKESRQTNLTRAKAALKERFGADYQTTLKEIADELSVTDSFLNDMATTSPDGLLKLVDSVRKPDSNNPVTPPRSAVDSSKNYQPNAGRKNKAYYDNIRRTDLKLYFTKKVQNEMHSEAVRQGQSFFE